MYHLGYAWVGAEGAVLEDASSRRLLSGDQVLWVCSVCSEGIERDAY